MKDIVAFSLDLDVNIHISINNTAKKRLFNCVVRAIKCYLPVKLLKYAKSIFLWLIKLSIFVGQLINLNRTKNKSHNKNGNINNGMDIYGGVDNEYLGQISCPLLILIYLRIPTALKVKVVVIIII